MSQWTDRLQNHGSRSSVVLPNIECNVPCLCSVADVPWGYGKWEGGKRAFMNRMCHHPTKSARFGLWAPYRAGFTRNQTPIWLPGCPVHRDIPWTYFGVLQYSKWRFCVEKVNNRWKQLTRLQDTPVTIRLGINTYIYIHSYLSLYWTHLCPGKSLGISRGLVQRIWLPSPGKPAQYVQRFGT